MQPSPSKAPQAVRDSLARALAEASAEPENDELWAVLDDAARDCDEPEDVSALYREVLDRELDAPTKLRIGERAVAFHDEWYDDSNHVIEILKRLTQLETGGDWAFEKLSLLLTI